MQLEFLIYNICSSPFCEVYNTAIRKPRARGSFILLVNKPPKALRFVKYDDVSDTRSVAARERGEKREERKEKREKRREERREEKREERRR